MEKACHAEPAICPVCGNPSVAEFFEPRGVALCMQCGASCADSAIRLVFSYHLEPDRITIETSLAKDFRLGCCRTGNGAGGRVKGIEVIGKVATNRAH